MNFMKIAIVTGASSGMGREMVYQLADRFGGLSEIWVIARRKERLDEFDGKLPLKVRKFAIDITDIESLNILKNELEVVNPDVKILVNSAGCGKYGKIGESTSEESSNMIRLNVEALTAVTELVLPYISANSRIIQFASAAAFVPQPGFAVYAATKSYVLSYSRALAHELKSRKISVTAVCPGSVETEFFDYALNGKKLPLYKKAVISQPEVVVKHAISDSLMGKSMSISGPIMKGFYLLCKFLPHDLIMKFIK